MNKTAFLVRLFSLEIQADVSYKVMKPLFEEDEHHPCLLFLMPHHKISADSFKSTRALRMFHQHKHALIITLCIRAKDEN